MRWAWLGLLIVIGLVWGARINLSASMPRGLYRVQRVIAPVTRGAIVIVHVPGWSARVLPFMKPVAAISGDTVCRLDDTLWLHGASYGRVYRRSQGHEVPAWLPDGTCQVVPPGYLFLASHADRSLDSRYFGPVAASSIRALATPLVTWAGE